MARGLVATGHQPGLHRREAPRDPHESVGADACRAEQLGHFVARCIVPEHAHGAGPRPERVDVVRGVGRSAQLHLRGP